MSPGGTPDDVSNGHIGNTEPLCQGDLGPTDCVKAPCFDDIGLVEPGRVMIDALRRSPVPFAILHVRDFRVPAEVAETIVPGVSIPVTAFKARRTGADECRQDKSVDAEVASHPVPHQDNARMAGPVGTGSQSSPLRQETSPRTQARPGAAISVDPIACKRDERPENHPKERQRVITKRLGRRVITKNTTPEPPKPRRFSVARGAITISTIESGRACVELGKILDDTALAATLGTGQNARSHGMPCLQQGLRGEPGRAGV